MTLANTALISLVQAKNYLRVNAAASLHVDAEYVGEGTGAQLGFDLDNTPVSGSLKLYLDNVLQVEDTDFSISAATITFDEAPADGDAITASYDYAASDNTFESYDDDLLEQLINAATKKAEDYTGRVFVKRVVVETHIGDGTNMLKLYRQPIDTEVPIAITIDGVNLDSWTERLSIGRLYHLIVWEDDTEIEVTYTAGYGDRAATQALIPDAVVAVLITVAFWYENRMGIKSQNIAGVGSVDYSIPGGLPEAAKGKLDSLRVNVL